MHIRVDNFFCDAAARLTDQSPRIDCAQNFDGSNDAIYKAAAAARSLPRRGAAEGEDFDFCCPSAPDDLFGFITGDKNDAAAAAGETEIDDNGPPGGLNLDLDDIDYSEA